MQRSHLQCSSEMPQNPKGEQQGSPFLGSHSATGPPSHARLGKPHLPALLILIPAIFRRIHYYCFNFKEGNFGFKEHLLQKFLFACEKIIKILPWMMLQVLFLVKSVVNFWDGDIATSDDPLNPTFFSSFWWTWINVLVSQLEFLTIALELKMASC